MAAGIQNSQAFYQTFYDEAAMQWLIPDNLPFLNMINKEDGLSGDCIDHPFLYGPAQGYSADFNTAATQAGNSARAVRATLRCSQAYSMVEFFDKDRALSLGDNAYMDLVEPIMTGKIMDFNNQLDMDAHAAGTGWRGTVGAVAGQVNPLNPSMTLGVGQIYVLPGFGLETAFNQDQQVQAATYAGFPTAGTIFPPSDGRLPSSLGGPVQIQAVDPINRVLTLSDASAFVVNSFIVQSGGAIGFNASNTYGGIIGMDAWSPYAPNGIPTTDNFCGVNRSTYGTRLASYSKDLSRLSVEDAIKRLSAIMSQGGSRTSNVALLNPLDFDALDSKLMTNTRYSTVTTATHGFDSVVINGAAGRIDCVPDPHQVQGYFRLIDPTTWVLRHKYSIPHIVSVEDRQMEQALNFDGRTARLRMYAQLCCMAPHKNGVGKLAQITN